MQRHAVDVADHDVKPRTRAFCRRFPNAVARNQQVSDKALVVLAYRSTIADDKSQFGLWTDALQKRRIVRGRGLGRDAIEKTISEAVRLAYLDRPHNATLTRRHGRFSRSVDRLRLPAVESDNDGRVVPRHWFDGTLSIREIAALIYISAGPKDGYGRAYAAEVSDRFGWPRSAAASVIGKLVKAGLVDQRRDRKADGTFGGISYGRTWISRECLAHGQEQPATEHQPGQGEPGYVPPGLDGPGSSGRLDSAARNRAAVEGARPARSGS